jgi:hypothetical protein
LSEYSENVYFIVIAHVKTLIRESAFGADSPDNIHYQVYIIQFTGGGFWNLFPFLEENSHALSTFPPSYTNPPISTFPPSLKLSQPSPQSHPKS